MSDKTIRYYDRNAEEFAAGTVNADMQELRAGFLKYLRPGAKILDAGCGSGRDALAFLKAGYEVDAFDGSAQMCRIASERTGISVRQLRFEDLAPPAAGLLETDVTERLKALQDRYGLDFAGNLDRIFRGETLYRTVEYMRKHRGGAA